MSRLQPLPERLAYGVLVAALEQGLMMTTLQHAMDVLKRFSAPGGRLGEQWLSAAGTGKAMSSTTFTESQRVPATGPLEFPPNSRLPGSQVALER